MSQAQFLNVPNVISLGRILVVPGLVVLLATIRPGVPGAEAWTILASQWAGVIFGVAALTDIVDGLIARRYKIVTVFGKLFDPLADKLLTFAALVMLIPIGRMPAWIVVLVLAREVGVNTLRSIASSEGIVIEAGKGGKIKSAFTSTGLTFLLFYYPFFGANSYYVGWVLFLIGVVYGLVSGVQYGVRFFQEMARRRAQ